MDYEVDFIGVKDDECSSDALAVCIRWKDYYGDFHVGIYDAGYEAHGNRMKTFLNDYYFNDIFQEDVIDFVCVSHSDQDHTGGIKTILENFKVKKLYMNRPWLYIDELKRCYSDNSVDSAGLERELREKYKTIAEIESIAEKNNIPICEAFTGMRVENIFTVLSPSPDFYIKLIMESRKTRLDYAYETESSSLIKKVSQYILSLVESWDFETLRENQKTTAENEMSIILLGENMLFTGDAGIRALNAADDFCNEINKTSISNAVNFIQVPHHGGRHNVSPSVLDKIVGKKVKRGSKATKTAYVGVAENSDHPLKMVVNAFIRRGCEVYKTNGRILYCQNGSMPKRKDGVIVTGESFSNLVEEWE